MFECLNVQCKFCTDMYIKNTGGFYELSYFLLLLTKTIFTAVKFQKSKYTHLQILTSV